MEQLALPTGTRRSSSGSTLALVPRVAAQAARRRKILRTITDDHGFAVEYRLCLDCHRWLPARVENFSPLKRNGANGVVMRWQPQCKGCISRRRDEGYRARIGKTVVPDTPKYSHRSKDLAALHSVPVVDATSKSGSHRRTHLPALPLAIAIRQIARREVWCNPYGFFQPNALDDRFAIVCIRGGVPDRSVRAWENGERAMVQVRLAEKVLTNLGLHWWEVWPEDRFPNVAAWLGELPPEDLFDDPVEDARWMAIDQGMSA